MRKRFIISAVFACVAMASSAAQGAISCADWKDDGDGVITCAPGSVGANGTLLSTTGQQNGSGPGHMVGTIATTDATDPTLTLASSLENDTGAAWVGYRVNVYMTSAFVLANPTINSPASWGTSQVIQPTYGATSLDGGNYAYVGSILFEGSPEIAVGDTIDFSYQMTFKGSTSYSFTQEMIPEFAAVPEPGIFGLLGAIMVGGMVFAKTRRV